MTPKPATREKTPLERMTELTRRLVAVPKSEIPRKRKTVKRKRH
jgi:hypothetical protein